jgi:hypothetical protein
VQFAMKGRVLLESEKVMLEVAVLMPEEREDCSV